MNYSDREHIEPTTPVILNSFTEVKKISVVKSTMLFYVTVCFLQLGAKVLPSR